MASESSQKKKERVRPPRVHISYDVERGGAQVQKELPFVVGVLADLAGNREEPLPALRDRKFTEIDRDNFDDVVKNIAPRFTGKVENKLTDDGSELAVDVSFKNLSDFRPENVAQQIEPLAKLLEVRNQLKDLLGRTEGNDRLEEMLGAILSDADVRDKLKTVLATESASSGEGEASGETPGGEES